MKIRLLILSLVVIAKCGLAQPHLFNLSNSVWSVFEHQTNKYFSNGDTIINSILYSKFYVNPDTLQINYLRGFMRQDTLQKKVYWLNVDSTQEHLIYDFSLNVGDTVLVSTGIYSIFGFAAIKVIAIDTLFLNGQNRKRFTLKNVQQQFFNQMDYWIEGIGSSSGIIMGSISAVYLNSEFSYPRLMCYNENDSLIYLNSGFISCYLPPIDNVIEVSETMDISIYPNPATDEINIVTGGVFDTGKPITVTISNYTGQVVFNNTYNTTYATINLNNFTNGLYIVTLSQLSVVSLTADC